MKVSIEEKLALLLINKGEPFANSYRIIKMFEWIFKIMNCADVLKALREGQLVDYDLINGIHHYTLTAAGENLILNNKGATIDELKKTYPQSLEIINNL